MRLAREGYRLIGGAAAVTLLAALAGWTAVALLALLLTLFFVNFFRDPDRLTPPGDHLITAPADGKVVAVLDGVREERFLKGECRRVSIFMSPLDVHVNRIPIDGTIVDVARRSGQFYAAYLDKASEFNEQTAVLLEDKRGERILFVQIAGQLARRIICRLRPGDRVHRAERYGMITFGSRLDLYLPTKVEVSVRVGDRVSAGTSVIGAYR
ncbi:MAG: phosphatidylserine decarboxylase family protein [Deltaproteobacteria bacterium]|nr:phosphatidylserine decarboxylase family protein [Deltaproteobacteria bacterium]